MPPVTCHILDTARGKPAPGVVVAIYRLGGLPEESQEELLLEETSKPFALAKTNADGRVPDWVFAPGDLSAVGIVGGEWTLQAGVYRMRFQTGSYFKQHTERTFFPFVDVLFTVADPPEKHYHIPLLLAAHSYTTYRGS